MPIEIKDIDGGVGVIITAFGQLTEKEWVDAHVEHLTQDENKFKKYRFSLSDYTAVTKVEVSNSAIYKIAKYGERAAQINPLPVVALAANQNLSYGLARMWEFLVDNTDWETMAFRNRGDAETWLKERVKEKFGIEDLIFG